MDRIDKIEITLWPDAELSTLLPEAAAKYWRMFINDYESLRHMALAVTRNFQESQIMLIKTYRHLGKQLPAIKPALIPNFLRLLMRNLLMSFPRRLESINGHPEFMAGQKPPDDPIVDLPKFSSMSDDDTYRQVKLIHGYLRTLDKVESQILATSLTPYGDLRVLLMKLEMNPAEIMQIRKNLLCTLGTVCDPRGLPFLFMVRETLLEPGKQILQSAS